LGQIVNRRQNNGINTFFDPDNFKRLDPLNKNKTMTKAFVFILILTTFLFACNNQQDKQKTEQTNDTSNKEDMTTDNLLDFGKRYAQAWCSQEPDSVASFFSENGSLTVNNGTPAIGREAISKVAQSFMTAFPDMIVSMDSLPTTPKGIEFHWTLTGTNTGPDGTGKKVQISGFELWQLDDKGLIKESQGSFDADEYNRQLMYGVDK